MRNTVCWNDGWVFFKDGQPEAGNLSTGEHVTLPHTWNAKDGQDGGDDYYRGTCWYAKNFERPALGEHEQLWLEFNGAAMTAEVFLNGKKLAHHEGGFSTFRVELTDALEDNNLLTVSADNSANNTVYPQKADFTFYGGLYRDVNLIVVPDTHFCLDYYGGSGIKVTPKVNVEDRTADVTVEAWVTGSAERVTFVTAEQTIAAPVEDGHASAVFHLDNVHLWDGVEDPYLYTATASLDNGDMVSARYGCRTIAWDADKGFLLNGRVYRLCGAARHQDRQGLGNALTEKEHEEDMALLKEMGANTVRLAHYQHAQYFYDLCDENGMVVWAEIPYITAHMPEARANTVSQMTELVVQNYNHPSIVCWGLSNEITGSGKTDDLVENHNELNDLCHRMDPTRATTMANIFMLDPNDPFVFLPDIRSFNLYYGWYVGDWNQNDTWFDDFHKAHPNDVIGLSEYGADANPAYQSANPQKGDWTEGYQALYHEHMLQMWSERPYIWAMHVWNMFDFAADGRNEGGKPGQNQKGMVTFDRKIKKDAFYIYKAYLSKEPFVHLCGSRYVDRAEDVTEIKVYSNQPEVSLYVDSQLVGTQTGDKIFRFQVPITGEHTIRAEAGEYTDTIQIRHVDEPNPSYVSPDSKVVNWFDRDDEIVREGYFSIKDTMGDIGANPEAGKILEKYMAPMMAALVESYGDVAKSVKVSGSMLESMGSMTVESFLQLIGKAATPAIVHEINGALNNVPKE